MSDLRPTHKKLDGKGRRIGIAVGRYNAEITQALLEGARDSLTEFGVAPGDIQVLEVSGAFELPLASQQLLSRGKHDAVIALGAVIRGGTPHFDYVCQAAMQGCLRVSLDAQKPVAFGVLTCDTLQQAQARAQPGQDNKGREAAVAVLESLSSLEQL